MPAEHRESQFDSNAHWHTQVAGPREAPTSFNTSAWTKVLTLCLGMLLALTMLDTTVLSTIATTIGDDSTPMAATVNPVEGYTPVDAEDGQAGWAGMLQAQELEPAALTPSRLTNTTSVSESADDAAAQQVFDFQAAFARVVLLGAAIVAVVIGLVVAILRHRKKEESEQGRTVGLRI